MAEVPCADADGQGPYKSLDGQALVGCPACRHGRCNLRGGHPAARSPAFCAKRRLRRLQERSPCGVATLLSSPTHRAGARHSRFAKEGMGPTEVVPVAGASALPGSARPAPACPGATFAETSVLHRAAPDPPAPAAKSGRDLRSNVRSNNPAAAPPHERRAQRAPGNQIRSMGYGGQ